MKTSQSARRVLRVRGMAIGLALLAMVALAFTSGQWLGKRSIKKPTDQSQVMVPPKIDLSELIAATP